MLKYITDFLLQGSSLVSDTLEEHDISLVALIPALFAVWFVGLLLYRWLLHPLAGIPGPFLAQFTGHWRNWHYLRGDWHDVIVDVHRKYGRVVRIAPNELSLVDEQAIRKLYSHGNHTEKTQWYATWDVPQTAPGLFATRDRKEHAFLRKRVSSAYSMTSLLKFEGYVQSCFDLLFEKLKKHAGEIVDMAEWTNAVAYDIVGELAYGEKLGHLQTETDVMGIRQAILDGFFLMANMGHYWGQSQIASNLFVAKITEMLGVPNNFSKFREWSVNKVRSRRQDMTKADRHDMLWHFMQMKDEKGNLASDPEVLIEAMNIIGAGADTTSIGMRACLYYTLTHPRVYRRLQAEIDEYFNARPSQQSITYNDARQLPYLHAVISEATRLHPSIVFQLLRKAPADFVIDGIKIPPGTEVGVSPRAQNRDTAIWGDDANEFRPERWLENEEQAKYFENITMTFGGNGPRMCIGRNLALVELHKYMAQLLRNFDVDFVNEQQPWNIKTFWFSYQFEMLVRVRLREHSTLV